MKVEDFADRGDVAVIHDPQHPAREAGVPGQSVITIAMAVAGLPAGIPLETGAIPAIATSSARDW